MTFAGWLFIVAAAFNVVAGVVAVAEPSQFFVSENGLLIDNYDAFGIWLLVLGGLQFFVGWGVLSLQRWAQIVGIILAILSAITQFGHFTYYPAWAVIILVLDAVILYALTAYSDEFSSR